MSVRSVPPRMAQLDGLRGVAVLWVVWSHAGIPLSFQFGAAGYGVYGVWVFFTLSAFLITGILLELRDRGAPLGGSLRSFYARRALRIAPAYYAVLLVLFVADVPRLDGYRGALLLFTTNWFLPFCPYSSTFAHFWSLAVEEQFYVVWPLLLFLVPAKRLQWVFLVAVCIAVISKVVLQARAFDEHAVPFLTTSCLDTLGLGAVLAWHRHERPTHARARRRVLRCGLAFGLFWLSIVALFSFNEFRIKVFGYQEALAVGCIAVWLIDRAASDVAGVQRSILTWRPLAFVGTVSYAIYLVHTPILWLVTGGRVDWYMDKHPLGAIAPWRGNVRDFVIVAGLSIAMAAFSWRYIEGPLNALKRLAPYPTRARAEQAPDRALSNA
jgi:peptidoglycan/LPS O-acetylase OafA/YrhL